MTFSTRQALVQGYSVVEMGQVISCCKKTGLLLRSFVSRGSTVPLAKKRTSSGCYSPLRAQASAHSFTHGTSIIVMQHHFTLANYRLQVWDA